MNGFGVIADLLYQTISNLPVRDQPLIIAPIRFSSDEVVGLGTCIACPDKILKKPFEILVHVQSKVFFFCQSIYVHLIME
jgi:hypothetical protein